MSSTLTKCLGIWYMKSLTYNEKNKKDVLFLCQFFHPEYVSSATLPYDTAKHLSTNGMNIGVLCGYPKEYTKSNHIGSTETINAIEIKRLKYIQTKRTSKLGRLINYFSFTLSALINISHIKPYKYIIVYSNPPLLPLVAEIAHRRYGTDYIYVSYDVYPEIAVVSKAIREDTLIEKVMTHINRLIFMNAKKIVALSDEMKMFLIHNREYKTIDQFITIPNWPHEDYTTAGIENDVDEIFTVSYFGNMGTCQDVDTILHAAERLKEIDNIRFRFVGHGNKTPYVKEKIKDMKLHNVSIESFATGKQLEQLYESTSACVVSLITGLKGLCAPSKYYSYLQMGKPVIAIVEKESYLANEINECAVGITVSQGEVAQLVENIRELSRTKSKCIEFGNNARKLFDSRYTKSIANDKYLKLFIDS